MKPQSKKHDFVRMRAEGMSYAAIAAELHISKATCTKWEEELKAAISERKAEDLEALYNSYYMTRRARIDQLGQALQAVNNALGAIDLTETPPEKLLDLKLKYMQALKEEYISTGRAESMPEEITPAALMELLKDLLQRVRSGETSTAQANRESLIIGNLLKAYEQTEIKAKLDQIEQLLAERERAEA